MWKKKMGRVMIVIFVVSLVCVSNCFCWFYFISFFFQIGGSIKCASVRVCVFCCCVYSQCCKFSNRSLCVCVYCAIIAFYGPFRGHTQIRDDNIFLCDTKCWKNSLEG